MPARKDTEVSNLTFEHRLKERSKAQVDEILDRDSEKILPKSKVVPQSGNYDQTRGVARSLGPRDIEAFSEVHCSERGIRLPPGFGYEKLEPRKGFYRGKHRMPLQGKETSDVYDRARAPEKFSKGVVDKSVDNVVGGDGASDIISSNQQESFFQYQNCKTFLDIQPLFSMMV